MSNIDFEIEGWAEFVEKFSEFVDKWEAKRAVLLKRMGNIYCEEVQKELQAGHHVDTSRLVDSIFVFGEGISQGYVEVGTNVEYALYVNDGHVQHKRFLPIKYISAGGKKKLVKQYGASRKEKKGGIGGIMLSERYVQGSFFMEKGWNSAKPRVYHLMESFMEKCAREVEGGKS